MIDDVEIGMMSADALFWRCLHGGPLTPQTLDHPEPHPRVPWERLRPRNLAFLARMTERYGACAVLARDGDRVVGQLRFYPKAVFEMAASPDGPGLCLQQTAPNGPAEDFADRAFPPIDEMADRTLRVHCIMTGSPGQKENPYQRKGVGSRLVRALADWARERGWAALEVRTGADLPCLYAVTGAAGRTFWEKLGFRVVETGVESAFVEDGNEGFVRAMLKEAAALGMDADEATAKYTMRLGLA